jgi:glutathione S-transferase
LAVIHLYRFRFSTNVERVTLALAHKNLEVESIWVDPRDRSPVEQLSGQQLVPVIDDGGRVVFDSTAILRYLEERYPPPPLYPHEEAQRAAVDIYIDWFNRVCKRPPNEIEAELLADRVDQQRVDELAAWMARNLDVHERLLAARDYLFGETTSRRPTAPPSPSSSTRSRATRRTTSFSTASSTSTSPSPGDRDSKPGSGASTSARGSEMGCRAERAAGP